MKNYADMELETKRWSPAASQQEHIWRPSSTICQHPDNGREGWTPVLRETRDTITHLPLSLAASAQPDSKNGASCFIYRLRKRTGLEVPAAAWCSYSQPRGFTCPFASLQLSTAWVPQIHIKGNTKNSIIIGWAVRRSRQKGKTIELVIAQDNGVHSFSMSLYRLLPWYHYATRHPLMKLGSKALWWACSTND